MFGLGKLISGAAAGTIGIAGGIFGARKARKQRKKMERYLNQQDADNLAWYNANALSDYTQREDTQALMKNLRDNMAQQNKKAANSAVVTGATPEQQTAQKEEANKVITDTYSRIGAMGQQWKDNITNQYLQRKDSIANQRMGIYEGRANSYEALMNNGFNALTDSFLSLAK